MKRLLSIVSIFCIATVFTACGAKDTPDVAEEEINLSDLVSDTGDYENTEIGITIKNSVEWQKIEDQFGALVVFLSKLEGEDDSFQENVSLVSEPLSQEMSVDDYATQSLSALENFLTKFELIDEKKVDLNGQSAFVREYAFEQGNITLHGMQYYTIHDKNAYILSYTAVTDSFDTFKKDALGIIESFIIE